MQITTVVVHNFRSIVEETFDFGDYTLLVGANNAGKSNFLDAIRIFHENSLKYVHSDDFPKFAAEDDESWIDITYVLSEEEYESLKDEYKRPNKGLKVRKYLHTQKVGKDKKPKHGIYGYVKEDVSDDHFYGVKNVQQGKLGEIIYVPAAGRLDDQTRLTGPSPLRELLNDILKKLVKSSGAFAKLTTDFNTFSSVFKSEKTVDSKSISSLGTDISNDIAEWDASFVLNINPVMSRIL